MLGVDPNKGMSPLVYAWNKGTMSTAIPILLAGTDIRKLTGSAFPIKSAVPKQEAKLVQTLLQENMQTIAKIGTSGKDIKLSIYQIAASIFIGYEEQENYTTIKDEFIQAFSIAVLGRLDANNAVHCEICLALMNPG